MECKQIYVSTVLGYTILLGDVRMQGEQFLRAILRGFILQHIFDEVLSSLQM